MDLALIASALLMGLAGSPHCTAMCGAGCAALCGPGRGARLWIFQAARLLSYSLAGAVVASTVGALASLGQAVAALRPLWTLVHLGAAALGAWLLWNGRQPAWLERLGRERSAEPLATRPVLVSGTARSAALDMAPARRAQGLTVPLLAGLGWVAWPCGLLQSALLVASLANGAAGGALAMAGFAVGSGLGLVIGPWLWGRWGPKATAWSVRLAGLALLMASGWSLGHGLWMRIAAWCGF